MKPLRIASAALATALAVALVAPSVSLACEARAHHCPGMPPELAALCHAAGTMAPDCCRHERPVPQRRAVEELGAATALALLPTAAGAWALADAVAAVPALGQERGDSRAAALHELGLFTLHAVFRI